ncbi:MAG: phosphomannomutase CpsG, partial [Gammaproteobacteria bacterium]|nr:phosphomannomutase CpsG [Gammaproteobacteria bacterium]
MPNKLTCFKAYDIRGQLGTQIDENIAYKIARAFGETLKPEVVVVGGDARETSEALKLAAAEGLRDAGVDVIDIGMAGTEEIYFAVSHLGTGGGIEVTASHNPIDYNGMKIVREDSKPVSGDTGLFDIQAVAEAADWAGADPSKRGSYQQQSLLSEYVEHLLGYIDSNNIKPLKLVVNSGNGAAGHVVDELELQFAKQGIPVE